MEKIDLFKKELFELLKKHDVKFHPSDQYDGEEQYCGTLYYLNIGGETDYGADFSEIIQDFIDESFL